MTNIKAHDFFRMDELPPDAALSGTELLTAFWQLKKMQRESQQQQTFWKSVNDSLADAYKKLAAVQEELRRSRKQLEDANETLEEEVRRRTSALREAQELSESIFSSLSDMLVVVDHQGVITKVNRAATQKLGLLDDELVGRPIRAILHYDGAYEPPLPHDWIERVLAEGSIRDHEVGYTSKTGEIIPVALNAARLEELGNDASGIVSIARDVSERRLAEKELLERLRQIEEQQATIRSLFTPIIEVWQGVQVLPIVGVLDAERVAEIMHDLLHAVTARRSAYVIIDLTGVKGVDADMADYLLKISRATGLLGAHCLLSGLSPGIARSFVGLDMGLSDLVSFGNLQSALQYSLSRMNALDWATRRGG